MTDADRTPVVRLEIDQQVFIDEVRAGDTLEDATVATEVTSFDRVGDAYVLEGAILFSGYVSRRTAAWPSGPDAEEQAWSPQGADGPFVQHIQHRMPFWLRVPVRAQPRGLVNVTSRITDWRLEVVDDAWVHIAAHLTITGLNHREGYHFQCGAQEEGDLFFGTTPLAAVDHEVTAVSQARHQAEEEERSDAEPGERTGEPMGVPAGERAGARTGVPAGDVAAPSTGVRAEPPAGTKGEDDAPARALQADLQAFDRAFTGAGHEPSALHAPGQPARGDVGPEAPWAEFEFVYQLGTDDPGLSPPDAASATPEMATGATDAASATPEMATGATDAASASAPATASASADAASAMPGLADEGEFVPSRSLGADGFHPAAGFVPRVQSPPNGGETQAAAGGFARPTPGRDGEGAAAGGNAPGHEPPAATAADELPAEAGAWPREPARAAAHARDSLWSFVDFNAPLTRYTIRYVVVQEDESLDAVADRVGCSKADLMRVNQLDRDTVYPGQTLRVPPVAAGKR
ncbi:LysM peptidoglycan-binding domain-containing protein [Alicyclobacillus cellulosilyticus]|uniref:LysM peptidoglycan-binding domain-containing protein n=1 Tax=Alicyclobacillus cellulosilyticus TaxID=1003997 RepID=UPI0016668826|nr:LysM peptidoglycan-binding domain-containing protein [Alicyclobacillus cellulosilyticus]